MPDKTILGDEFRIDEERGGTFFSSFMHVLDIIRLQHSTPQFVQPKKWARPEGPPPHIRLNDSRQQGESSSCGSGTSVESASYPTHLACGTHSSLSSIASPWIQNFGHPTSAAIHAINESGVLYILLANDLIKCI